MKNKFARIMALAFSLSLMVLMLSCGTKGKSNVESHDLVLQVGELYKIPGIADDAVVFNGLFKSEDTSIAEVQGGRYIKAFCEGETKVYGTIDGVDIEYVVSVQEDEDRLPRRGVKPIQDKSVYLGGGYNMLTAKGMEIYREINSSAIFLPDTIKKYADDNMLTVDFTDDYGNPIPEKDENGEIIYEKDADGNYKKDKNGDKIPKTKKQRYTTVYGYNDLPWFHHKAIKGNSAEEYADSYKTAIEGKLGLKLSSLSVKGAVQGKYEDGNVKTETKNSAMASYLGVVNKTTYSLTIDKAALRELAKKNTYAWKAITGSMPPSEVFARYGTHYVTEVYLGGRVDIDFKLEASNSSVENKNILEIAGNIAGKIGMVEIDASGNYSDVKVEEAKNSNYTTRITISAQGGNNSLAQGITIDNFSTTFKKWTDSLSIGDGGQDSGNLAIIGFSDSGLQPIWWLLEDSSENPEEGARAEELRKAYLELGGPVLAKGFENTSFEQK